jgi:hypothetical protein
VHEVDTGDDLMGDDGQDCALPAGRVRLHRSALRPSRGTMAPAPWRESNGVRLGERDRNPSQLRFGCRELRR